MNFSALIDPSTTLGAFLISLVAGIFGGLFIGFITGSNYQKRKINKIRAKRINGDIYQGNREEGGKGSSKTKNVIKADTIDSAIVQDSQGVIADGRQKPDKGK